MGFITAIPLVIVGLLCFGLGHTIASRYNFYADLAASQEHDRAAMIDGLRGWLALGVLLTHAACMYFYFADGSWGSEGAWPYSNTGPMGVCLFFMVTAFLFWSRVLRAPAGLDWIGFFRSRVRRIAPMYFASVAMVLVVVAFASGFELRSSPYQLARQIRPWLTFGFLADGDINGVRAHYINAAYWTLAYEWAFYLALPLLAVFARGMRFVLLLAAATPFCYSEPVTFCFIFGVLAAWIVEHKVIPFPLDRHWLTPLPLAALLLASTYEEPYAFMPILLLFVFFVFVVGKNSLFGLLATRAAKVLGAISYSIYLTHCIVLYVTVSIAHAFRPVHTMSIQEYVTAICVAAALTVLLSMVTYRYIERPFLSKRTHADAAAGGSTGRVAGRTASAAPMP